MAPRGAHPGSRTLVSLSGLRTTSMATIRPASTDHAVAGDRGCGDDIEGVDADSHRVRAHPDAGHLVHLVQPPRAQPIALGAQQERHPVLERNLIYRYRRLIRSQGEQAEPDAAKISQPAVPVRHAGIWNREHRAHRHLDRPPVERIRASRRQDHCIHAKRSRASEDGTDVRVVDKILQYDDASGVLDHLGDPWQRQPPTGGQGAAVHWETSQPLGVLLPDEVGGRRGVVKQISKPATMLPGQQEGPHRVTRRDGPPDHLFAFGQKQTAVNLQTPAQVDVTQPDVIGDPRIAWIIDIGNARHIASVAKIRAARACGHVPAQDPLRRRRISTYN